MQRPLHHAVRLCLRIAEARCQNRPLRMPNASRRSRPARTGTRLCLPLSCFDGREPGKHKLAHTCPERLVRSGRFS